MLIAGYAAKIIHGHRIMPNHFPMKELQDEWLLQFRESKESQLVNTWDFKSTSSSKVIQGKSHIPTLVGSFLLYLT